MHGTEDVSQTQALELDDVTKALMELTSDCAFVVTANGTIAAINREAERTFGFTGSDIDGLNVSALFPELDPAAAEERAGAFETACRDRHGRKFKAILKILRNVGAERNLAVITGRVSFRDKREILRSEGRFQAILDTTTAVIYAKAVTISFFHFRKCDIAAEHQYFLVP